MYIHTYLLHVVYLLHFYPDYELLMIHPLEVQSSSLKRSCVYVTILLLLWSLLS